MRAYLKSKKGCSTILGALTILALAWMKAPGDAYLAAGAVFGLHQAAQGAQDWRNGGKDGDPRTPE